MALVRQGNSHQLGIVCPHCQEQLCPLLRKQTLSLDREPSFKNSITSTDDGNRLSTSGAEIVKWARTGCPLGAFLMENTMGDDDIRDLDLIITVKTWRRSLRGELYRADFKVEVKTILREPGEESRTGKTLGNFSAEVFTHSDDPLSLHIFGRPVTTELGSRDNLDLARSWISRCTQGKHRSCPPAREAIYPLRLLNVWPEDTGGPEIVRLQISTPGQLGNYLALSYCWGPGQTFVATTATIPSMLCAIPLRAMPKTFRDAVYLTRELGYQYIWIDALCIIQDSDSDKAEQISHMQDIYRNATFTISASRSADCRDGFLGPVHFGAELNPERASRKIPYRTPDGFAGFIQLRKLNIYNTSLQPIHKRCWTFQEHFLSRRVLSFGDQIGWRCAGGEDLNFGFPREEMASFDRASPLGMPKLNPVNTEDVMWDTIREVVHEVFGAYEEITNREKVSNGNITEMTGEMEEGMARMTGKTTGGMMSDTASEMTEELSKETRDMTGEVTSDTASEMTEELSRETRETRDMTGEVMSDTASDTASDASSSFLDGLLEALEALGAFGEIFYDPAIQSFFANTEVRSTIQTAIVWKDLSALFNAFNPLLVQIVKIGIENSWIRKQFKMTRKVRSALKAAVEIQDGLGILQVILMDTNWLSTLEQEGIQVPTLEDEDKTNILSFILNLIEAGTDETRDQRRVMAPHWFVVVEQYSQRALSNPTDRLPALSGIATEFSELIEGEYLAGLWRKHIIDGLMWHQDNQVKSRRWPWLIPETKEQCLPPRRHPYIAPSWSWAAAEGPISYPNIQGKVSGDVKVLECKVTLAVLEKVFGEAVGGFLSIRGPVKKVDQTWFTGGLMGYKETNPDSNSQLAYLLDTEQNPWDYSEHFFWLLELFQYRNKSAWHSQGLVLEKVGDNVYKRVGVYKWICQDWESFLSLPTWLMREEFYIKSVFII